MLECYNWLFCNLIGDNRFSVIVYDAKPGPSPVLREGVATPDYIGVIMEFTHAQMRTYNKSVHYT